MPTLNKTKSLENINPVSIPTPKMIFFDIDDTLSRGGQLPRGFQNVTSVEVG